MALQPFSRLTRASSAHLHAQERAPSTERAKDRSRDTLKENLPPAARSKTRRPLGDEIERVWQLERTIRVLADKIAFLIADVGNNRFAEPLNLDALIGFVS